MNAQQLAKELENKNPPTLLNVLPPEAFETGHLPQSLNACIYEVAFSETIQKLFPDKSTPIVAYGDGGREAEVACKTLRDLGYSEIREFEGGLTEWKAAGFPLQGQGETAEGQARSGVYQVDIEDSLIRWTGRNLFNHHHGTLKLKAGQFILRANKPQDAWFEVDMTSIFCEDIPEGGMRDTLIKHLWHSDFFDVQNYPTARFTLQKVTEQEQASPGTPNFLIEGQFSIRGHDHTQVFEALIAAHPQGERITAQAELQLDRTLFGSIYGSGRVFRHLGPHLVNDHIHLHLKIHADRKSDEA
ncbi:MAG: YceI family protein [Verrucomicrobiales bacterium]